MLISPEINMSIMGNVWLRKAYIARGAEIKKKWDMIPEDTDILITHGPFTLYVFGIWKDFKCLVWKTVFTFLHGLIMGYIGWYLHMFFDVPFDGPFC